MRCPQCSSTSFESIEASGDTVCTKCGTVIEESNIVSAVEFQETSGGASSVIGQYISATATRPYGVSGPGYGLSREAREMAQEEGRRSISQLASRLNLSSHFSDSAFRLFILAIQNRFTSGRRSEHVVAACLYIICRREKSHHLLIDFSDALNANVFSLGATFLKLTRLLNIKMPVIDPSLYINRFVARMGVGTAAPAVATTALRLVARMRRDWIQTGRRPAGVCGACLLIAARLHGFAHTRSEVQSIVRVTDLTIRNRLAEFENTPSSMLTPSEFLQLGDEDDAGGGGSESVPLGGADDSCDPPAYTRGLLEDALARERLLLEDALAADMADSGMRLTDARATSESAVAADGASHASAIGGATPLLALPAWAGQGVANDTDGYSHALQVTVTSELVRGGSDLATRPLEEQPPQPAAAGSVRVPTTLAELPPFWLGAASVRAAEAELNSAGDGAALVSRNAIMAAVVNGSVMLAGGTLQLAVEGSAADAAHAAFKSGAKLPAAPSARMTVASRSAAVAHDAATTTAASTLSALGESSRTSTGAAVAAQPLPTSGGFGFAGGYMGDGTAVDGAPGGASNSGAATTAIDGTSLDGDDDVTAAAAAGASQYAHITAETVGAEGSETALAAAAALAGIAAEELIVEARQRGLQPITETELNVLRMKALLGRHAAHGRVHFQRFRAERERKVRSAIAAVREREAAESAMSDESGVPRLCAAGDRNAHRPAVSTRQRLVPQPFPVGLPLFPGGAPPFRASSNPTYEAAAMAAAAADEAAATAAGATLSALDPNGYPAELQAAAVEHADAASSAKRAAAAFLLESLVFGVAANETSQPEGTSNICSGVADVDSDNRSQETSSQKAFVAPTRNRSRRVLPRASRTAQLGRDGDALLGHSSHAIDEDGSLAGLLAANGAATEVARAAASEHLGGSFGDNDSSASSAEDAENAPAASAAQLTEPPSDESGDVAARATHGGKSLMQLRRHGVKGTRNQPPRNAAAPTAAHSIMGASSASLVERDSDAADESDDEPLSLVELTQPAAAVAANAAASRRSRKHRDTLGAFPDVGVGLQVLDARRLDGAASHSAREAKMYRQLAGDIAAATAARQQQEQLSTATLGITGGTVSSTSVQEHAASLAADSAALSETAHASVASVPGATLCVFDVVLNPKLALNKSKSPATKFPHAWFPRDSTSTSLGAFPGGGDSGGGGGGEDDAAIDAEAASEMPAAEKPLHPELTVAAERLLVESLRDGDNAGTNFAASSADTAATASTDLAAMLRRRASAPTMTVDGRTGQMAVVAAANADFAAGTLSPGDDDWQMPHRGGGGGSGGGGAGNRRHGSTKWRNAETAGEFARVPVIENGVGLESAGQTVPDEERDSKPHEGGEDMHQQRQQQRVLSQRTTSKDHSASDVDNVVDASDVAQAVVARADDAEAEQHSAVADHVVTDDAETAEAFDPDAALRETFSDVGDSDVEGCLLPGDEAARRAELWNALHGQYLAERAAKAAAAAEAALNGEGGAADEDDLGVSGSSSAAQPATLRAESLRGAASASQAVAKLLSRRPRGVPRRINLSALQGLKSAVQSGTSASGGAFSLDPTVEIVEQRRRRRKAAKRTPEAAGGAAVATTADAAAASGTQAPASPADVNEGSSASAVVMQTSRKKRLAAVRLDSTDTGDPQAQINSNAASESAAQITARSGKAERKAERAARRAAKEEARRDRKAMRAASNAADPSRVDMEASTLAPSDAATRSADAPGIAESSATTDAPLIILPSLPASVLPAAVAAGSGAGGGQTRKRARFVAGS